MGAKGGGAGKRWGWSRVPSGVPARRERRGAGTQLAEFEVWQSTVVLVYAVSVSRVKRCASPTAKPLRGRDHEFESKRLKLYGPSLTEVCTGPPGAIGCVGPCALCLGSVAHARSVVFCQPMTAFTCTGPEGDPKVTNALGPVSRAVPPLCMVWLTTEVLKRRAIVCYATLESFLIAKPSIPWSREA